MRGVEAGGGADATLVLQGGLGSQALGMFRAADALSVIPSTFDTDGSMNKSSPAALIDGVHPMFRVGSVGFIRVCLTWHGLDGIPKQKLASRFDLPWRSGVSVAIVINSTSLANAGVLMSTHRHARRSP